MNRVILTGSVVGPHSREDRALHLTLASAFLPADAARPVKPMNLHHKVAVAGHLGEVTSEYAEPDQALYVEGHLEGASVVADQVFVLGGSSLPALLQP